MKLPSGWIAIPKLDRKGKHVIVETVDLILCKDCKYFDYDSAAKVDGIPLIVAHEICNRWGDGCKTREDGWCFLAEQREEQAYIKENSHDI